MGAEASGSASASSSSGGGAGAFRIREGLRFGGGPRPGFKAPGRGGGPLRRPGSGGGPPRPGGGAVEVGASAGASSCAPTISGGSGRAAGAGAGGIRCPIWPVAAAAGPFGQVAPAAEDHRPAARHAVRAVAAGLQGLHEVRVVAGLHEVHFDPAAAGLHEVHPVEQAARREARDLAADHHEARAAAAHHEVRFGQVQADGGAQEREVAHPPFRRERRSLVPVSQLQAVPRLFSSTIGCPRRGCGRGFSLFLKV